MAQARKRSQKEKKAAEMPVLNANAAGIDIGAFEIYVAVHPDSDPEPVLRFTRTPLPDLRRRFERRAWDKRVDGPYIVG